MDLDLAGRFAVQVAEEAGQLLRNFYGLTDYSVKEDGSLQTRADIESEMLICDRIRKNFPQTGILAEESAHSLRDKEFFWVCDPLDGTTNFANQLPMWGVSIALMYNFQPLVGVIHIPLFEETVLAINGRGTICNGNKAKLKDSDGKLFSNIYTFCSWRSNSFSSELPGNIRALG